MRMLRTTPTVLRGLPRAILAGTVLLGTLVAAPAVYAQAYDTSLRSIGPATINQTNFDMRSRSPIQSIGAASVENRSAMVPAVYDPSLGRFVSATSPSRGAISVSGSSGTSVIVNSQTNVFVVGSSASGSQVRSESIASPSATVVTSQISAVPAAGNGR